MNVERPEAMSFERNVGAVESALATQNVDCAGPESAVGARVLAAEVRAVLGELTEREQDVLAARFGLGGRTTASLEELGAQLGVTRERVRQIEARAIQKLRRSPEAYKRLRDFYLDC